MGIEALRENALGQESKLAIERIRARHPELLPYVTTEVAAEGATHNLMLTTPSPTGDGTRDAYLWMECGDEPSVGWGHWHRHFDIAGSREDAVASIDRALDLMADIVSGHAVLLYDAPYPGSQTCSVLRVDDENTWTDELGSEHAPDALSVRTWSGLGDHELSVDEDAPDLMAARLRAAHLGIGYRAVTEASDRCGCFHCQAMFPTSEIIE